MLASIWTFTFTTIAQQGGATYYTYDDNGRLRGVIAPSGEGNIYEYDPAGNITAIRKLTANTLEVFDFTPRQGGPGTLVTIFDTGFGAGVTLVKLNGLAAKIISVNAPVLVAEAPQNVTSSPISVTAGGNTVTTVTPFSLRIA